VSCGVGEDACDITGTPTKCSIGFTMDNSVATALACKPCGSG